MVYHILDHHHGTQGGNPWHRLYTLKQPKTTLLATLISWPLTLQGDNAGTIGGHLQAIWGYTNSLRPSPPFAPGPPTHKLIFCSACSWSLLLATTNHTLNTNNMGAYQVFNCAFESTYYGTLHHSMAAWKQHSTICKWQWYASARIDLVEWAPYPHVMEKHDVLATISRHPQTCISCNMSYSNNQSSPWPPSIGL